MPLRSLIVFERLEDMGLVAYAQGLHLLCFYLFVFLFDMACMML